MTIPEILFANEPAIRLGAFAGVLAAMALWELVAPRRHQSVGRGRRWPNNLGVVVVDTLLVRLVFASAAVGRRWSPKRAAGGCSGLSTRRPGLS
jgi:hypothetical protein